MKLTPVMAFIFALLIFGGFAQASIRTSSYVEYVEIGDYYYGGNINWVITGGEVRILKDGLKAHYDWNHDGALNNNEMRAYLENLRDVMINQTVGTVIIKDLSPQHEWENMKEDVMGLWNLTTQERVIIKMRFSGVASMRGFLNSLNLSVSPFIAAYNTTFKNATLINLLRGDIRIQHSEIGASLTSYTTNPDGILLRLVVGNYYYYSGGIPRDERIERVDFSPTDNPLVLFVILLVSGKIAGIIERRNYDRHINEGSTFSRRKKVSWINLGIKSILIFLYIFATLYTLRVAGLVFISVCIVYVLAVGIASERIYSLPLPSVKKGILMVEDVYLLSKSGILISHETRRLKPEVDEDVLSSMLVAIQDFVRESFKDEGNVELKTVEFGDKKIFIERGEYLILAAVLRGEVDRYVKFRVSEVLKEIERKYQEILPSWKGDVEKFRGVREILRKIWE